MTQVLPLNSTATRRAFVTSSPRSRLAEYAPALLLCLVATLLLFWGLGRASLEDWDEALYMQMCKEMVRGGDWLTLHLDGKPWYDKPPLFFWATSLVYKLFGITEFTSRAVSAMSGVGVLTVTWLIGRRVYDQASGVVAGVVLLSCFQFVWSSRFATTDVMLTFFLLLSIYGYLRLDSDGPRAWYLICLSITAAFMIKSAAAIVAPAAIALAAFLDGQAVRSLRNRHFWLAVLLSLVIVLPWHLYMIARHGEPFWRVYFGWNLVERATSTFDQHTGGREYYLDRLHKYFFPWVWLVPFALAAELERHVRGRARSRIVLVYTLVVLLLYTLVRTKLRWYIVPLYPTLALMCGALIVRAVRHRDPAALTGLIVAAIAATLMSTGRAPVAIAAAAAAAALSLAVWSAQPPVRAVAAIAGAVLIALGVLRVVPLYTAGESQTEAIARVVRKQPGTDPLIAADGFERPAARFYCDRSILWADSHQRLHEYMADGQPRDVIIQTGRSAYLNERYHVEVLGRAKGALYARLRPRVDANASPTSQPVVPAKQ